MATGGGPAPGDGRVGSALDLRRTHMLLKPWPTHLVAIVCCREADPYRVPSLTAVRRLCWSCAEVCCVAPESLAALPEAETFAICVQCVRAYVRQSRRPMQVVKDLRTRIAPEDN